MDRQRRLACIAALAAALYCLPAAAQQTERQCAVCGSFYTENPQQLRTLCAEFLKNAAQAKRPDGTLIALLAPHAGYYYSGQTAAYSFAAAQDNYDTVVILGAGHTTRLNKAALNSAVYKTPIGNVPTDDAVMSALLRRSDLFELNSSAHTAEHSIEVQLPLLLSRLKSPFKLVPVLLNASGGVNSVAVGKAIAAAVKGRKALLVISSDLSHYPAADTARASDLTILEAAKTLKPDYLARTAKELEAKKEKNLEVAACGIEALEAGIAAAVELGANQAELLKYSNSSDIPAVPPDKVVGYAAMAFLQTTKPEKKPFSLSAPVQRQLLQAARQSIAEALEGKKLFPSKLSPLPELNLPAAVFVTLTDNGKLRGCIGTTEPLGSLQDSVRYYARLAAFSDSRFEPLKEPELPRIKLEISILSTPEPVSSAAAVIPGKHGVIVERGWRKGLFLPQVWEQLPAKESFLGELCEQKAGLDRNCWKAADSKLYIFTDYAFSD